MNPLSLIGRIATRGNALKDRLLGRVRVQPTEEEFEDAALLQVMAEDLGITPDEIAENVNRKTEALRKNIDTETARKRFGSKDKTVNFGQVGTTVNQRAARLRELLKNR